MMKWLLSRWISKFERKWNYDASYLRDVLDADPRALTAFGKVAALSSYRKDVPPAAYCAAGIVGTMTEDCGPCTQLVLDMAQREGVAADVLRAIVARDCHAVRSRTRHALCGSESASRAGSRRLARGSRAPLRQARPGVACFRYDHLAPISDLEVRARAWPRLHPPHHRR
jgi:hypothetical protein